MTGTAKKDSRREKIRQAIEALRDKHGRVTPQMVVRAARNPKHVLHSEFEWNDKKAADESRLDTARELIRFVTVVVVSDNKTIVTPFYVRDPMRKSNESGSIALTSDLIDRKNAEAIMLAELDRCEAAITRARGIVGTLDKEHRGLSRKLETMLLQIVEARELVMKKAA